MLPIRLVIIPMLKLISPDGFESPGFEYRKAPNVTAVLGLMRLACQKLC
jgi:hypothetical protein